MLICILFIGTVVVSVVSTLESRCVGPEFDPTTSITPMKDRSDYGGLMFVLI